MSARLVGDQGWHPIAELALAILLCSLIGLEREWRHKQTGLRTHTLVGVAAALFVIVSKYGFNDVLGGNVVVDPSRVAAQIVSGIGFIGGGLIFVRGDAVRGLTTAAIIWMTTAVGMACGAGLTAVAVLATACHFLVVLVYPGTGRQAGSRRATAASRSASTTRMVTASCARSSPRSPIAGSRSSGSRPSSSIATPTARPSWP